MSGPPVGTSVEDVVATVAHAGLERVLELRLGAEALVGPAAEPPSTHVPAAPLSRSPESSRSPPPPGAQHLLLHASTTDLMPRAGRGSDTKADDRDASSDDRCVAFPPRM